MPDRGAELDAAITDEALSKKLAAAERARDNAKVELNHVRLLLKDKDAEVVRANRQLSLYDREWKGKMAVNSPKKGKSSAGTLVSIMSDTHYGEVVDSREMGGFNAYDLQVAEERTARYFDKLVTLPRDYMKNVEIETFVLCLGGDIVSGDIHDELTETNEMSTYETVETVLPWLIAGLTRLAKHYPKVLVVSAPGNHGRRTRKPHAKRFSSDNADTHIARLLALHFDSDERIGFAIPRSLESDFNVYGMRFRLEHGQTFRGGDGQVGALGPVKRGVLRAKQASLAEGRPFDIMLLGHFHQLVMAPGQSFVMNGAMKGYDEYARTNKFAPEPAQQALFLVTPKHGVVSSMPVLLQ